MQKYTSERKDARGGSPAPCGRSIIPVSSRKSQRPKKKVPVFDTSTDKQVEKSVIIHRPLSFRAKLETRRSVNKSDSRCPDDYSQEVDGRFLKLERRLQEEEDLSDVLKVDRDMREAQKRRGAG